MPVPRRTRLRRTRLRRRHRLVILVGASGPAFAPPSSWLMTTSPTKKRSSERAARQLAADVARLRKIAGRFGIGPVELVVAHDKQPVLRSPHRRS